LEQAAAQLGSDVPFLLHGGCAVGRGRGSELTPVLTRGNFHWVLATFFTGLSTANIYRDADRLRGADAWPDPVVPQQVLRALSQGDVELLGATLANDLQPAALAARPDLADVLELGRSLGALGGIVSGSGPTCVFLTESEVHSLDLAAALRSSGQVSAALAVHGPVHGARVIPD
jgi:4-diphosphocytidyl-2-C-methyl-D-erythritol kinase